MEEDMKVNEIYGDLTAVAAEAAATKANNESRLAEAEKTICELRGEIDKLKSEARVWAKQRSVLVHNMSSLLKTAKLEISRKDGEIALRTIRTVMGNPLSKPEHSYHHHDCTISSETDSNLSFRFPVRPAPAPDIPHDKRLAKRQIEVYYRDFFSLYHDRAREMARIDSAAHFGEIDETTRLRLRKEQFMRELEYIRKKRNPMSMAHYEIIRKIGQGSFGEVFLVRHRGDRRLYAMKKLQKKDMIYKRQVNHVWLERFVLASVGEHPLVVKMHYSFQDQQHLYFIMEYLHGGDMMTMLIRQEYLPIDSARFYIAELVVAIDALHRTGIIHRDIKPDNILFRRNGHICLSDFGLSKSLMQPADRQIFQASGADYVNTPNFIEYIRRGDVDLPLESRVKLWKDLAKEKAFSQVGTPNYIAPEVLQDHSYSESCDWWSVGVILFEMLVGYPPFCARNPAHVATMICQWRSYLHFPKELPKSRLSDEAKDLIRRLLREAPFRLGANRGLEEFKEHPFFTGVDWDNLAHARAPFIPDLKSETDTRYFEDDITSTVITQPKNPSLRDDTHSSATSGSSGSGKDDGSKASGQGVGRRSRRRMKYDRNRDLEFVGFTFIPRRLESDPRLGVQRDLYNPPSAARVDQASPMTDALSLETNPTALQLKPLRSPRGPLAEATIAAAEVTSRDTETPRPIADVRKEAENPVVEEGESSRTSSVRVRFKEINGATQTGIPGKPLALSLTDDVSTSVTASGETQDGSAGEEGTPPSPGFHQRSARMEFDDFSADLGAVPVTEVSIEGEQEAWEKKAQRDVSQSTGPNIPYCLSLPELHSKPEGGQQDLAPENRDHELDSLRVGSPGDGSPPDGVCEVIRRTSRLNTPDEIPVFGESSKKPPIPSRPDAPSLPPSSSEVDLFMAHAERAINNAARELTNTPNSTVLEVVRHAKDDLSGMAANIQEALVPAESTSTASEETDDFPEESPEPTGGDELRPSHNPLAAVAP